ncbi:MAG TPA: hypothetical protein VFH06_04865 [Candidatus Saccharimonadales bacterium]|nr:hypothetical protein [Candidatus Saccharimonadales bacterium]
MNLPSLDEIAARAGTYQPNEHVGNSLRKKHLIMFVGPVATGKTFIMKKVAGARSDFGLVTSFTTREPREDDDPTMFRYLPHDKPHIQSLIHKIDAGEVVQYAIHPTSHRFYGSEPQDYPYTYNMLATLSGVVEPMSSLPFEKNHRIGLVCHPEVWEIWLKKRFPTNNEDQKRRMREAIQSLEWLLETSLPIVWIENNPESAEKTISDTLDAVLYNKANAGGRELAKAMLKKAKELI